MTWEIEVFVKWATQETVVTEGALTDSDIISISVDPFRLGGVNRVDNEARAAEVVIKFNQWYYNAFVFAPEIGDLYNAGVFAGESLVQHVRIHRNGDPVITGVVPLDEIKFNVIDNTISFSVVDFMTLLVEVGDFNISGRSQKTDVYELLESTLLTAIQYTSPQFAASETSARAMYSIENSGYINEYGQYCVRDYDFDAIIHPFPGYYNVGTPERTQQQITIRQDGDGAIRIYFLKAWSGDTLNPVNGGIHYYQSFITAFEISLNDLTTFNCIYDGTSIVRVVSSMTPIDWGAQWNSDRFQQINIEQDDANPPYVVSMPYATVESLTVGDITYVYQQSAFRPGIYLYGNIDIKDVLPVESNEGQGVFSVSCREFLKTLLLLTGSTVFIDGAGVIRIRQIVPDSTGSPISIGPGELKSAEIKNNGYVEIDSLTSLKNIYSDAIGASYYSMLKQYYAETISSYSALSGSVSIDANLDIGDQIEFYYNASQYTIISIGVAEDDGFKTFEAQRL